MGIVQNNNHVGVSVTLAPEAMPKHDGVSGYNMFPKRHNHTINRLETLSYDEVWPKPGKFHARMVKGTCIIDLATCEKTIARLNAS